MFYEDVRAKRLAVVAPDLYFKFPGVTEESLAVWAAEAKAVNCEPKSLISKKQNERMLLDLFEAEEMAA